MSKDLTERLESIDGQSADFSDPNFYSSLLGYEQDGVDEASATDPQGDTAAAAAAPEAAAAAPAPAPAPAAQAPAAAAPAAPEAKDSSAAPAAAEPKTGADAIAGVATRDGKHVIPYAVLEKARREALEANRRAKEAEDKLKEALAKATPSGNADSDALAARAASDPDSLTEAEIEELATDFPHLAKPLRVLRRLAEATQAPAPAPAASKAPAPAEHDDIDETVAAQALYDQALAANPLVAKWEAEGGPMWERAKEVDRMLSGSPKWKDKPFAERLAKVEELVADEFDIQRTPPAAPPAPAAAPAAPAGKTPGTPADATPAAAPVAATALPTLTDLGGRPAVTSPDPLAGMTTGQMVDKAMGMSVEELQRLAGLPY
jgi:hypothetical protein